MSYRKVVLSASLCFIFYLLPQNIFSDIIDKANRYYDKYDYKFAIEIYEKVMLKKPSLEVAEKLANCYRFINNSEGAERAYARVLTFPDFNAVNYLYYADALKQNGKFQEAKESYLLYGQKLPAQAELAQRLANGAEAARMWSENPDPGVRIDNAVAYNTEYAEFSPAAFESGYIFVSDRWFTPTGSKKGKKEEVYGWTGNPYLKLYASASKDEKSPKIDVFSEQINNQYHNGPAVFTSSFDTVFFTRADKTTDKKSKGVTISKKSIYFSTRTQGKWSDAQQLPFNTPATYSVQHPALSPDGSILYFASDMPGGSGGMDLYASKKQSDGSWGTPVNCGTNINSDQDDVFPYVRKDGMFFFSSKGHVGMGGLDIFSAAGAFNEFGIPENVKSPLNSSKDDFGVLYFDELSGFISSNRKGGKGLDDIYRFAITPPPAERAAEMAKAFAVEGQVVDKFTGAPLNEVTIILVNKASGEEKTTTSDSQGRFHFDLEGEMDYVIRGDNVKYFSRQEGDISTRGVAESTVFNVRFALEQSQGGLLVRLNNIYYDFNKWNIRADAGPELQKVVKFLNSSPGVKIELRSHTDSRGPAAYNQWLSQKRAESAVAYLTKHSISTDRVTALGLGESELLNGCRDGAKCSLKAHQLNRRTEFKVVKVHEVRSTLPAPMANTR